MASSNHVVLINFHGGFPPCYESAARDHLDCFRTLAAQGCDAYTRVYPTNACAGAALHDLLIDAPLHSMTDACWHPWSKNAVALRSLFTMLRDRGYKTHMLGAYGLDSRFDQHRHMRDHPYHLELALDHMGVDVFDVDDAAFTCRTAVAHDCEVLERLGARLAEWHPSEKHVIMVNLLACQDVHKCSWADAVHEARTPVLSSAHWRRDDGVDGDVRGIPESALTGDPRAGEEGCRMDVALRRLTMLSDYLRGEPNEPPSRSTLTHAVNALHRHVWSVLCTIDARLAPILRSHLASASESRASYFLFSDHAMSLYEHGVTCEAPWDACTRGFLCACTPLTRARGSARRPPCASPACVVTLIHDRLEECTGVSAAAWHPLPRDGGAAVTLCVAGSQLCRSRVAPVVSAYTLPYMWARVVLDESSRTYSVVYWWSIDDMMNASDSAAWLAATSDGERDRLVASRSMWTLPLESRWCDPDAAYDLSCDANELQNLCRDTEWISGDKGRCILERAKSALHDYHVIGRGGFRLRMPKCVSNLSPDEVALCSVQVRPQMTAAALHADRTPSPSPKQCPSVRDACTQTVLGVAFAQPIVQDVLYPSVTDSIPSENVHPAIARARLASASSQKMSIVRREAMRHERMRN